MRLFLCKKVKVIPKMSIWSFGMKKEENFGFFEGKFIPKMVLWGIRYEKASLDGANW